MFGSRRRPTAEVTDPWPLGLVLFLLSKLDPFLLRRAFEGILVMGATGSGKSSVTGSLIAQTKTPPSPADYGQWETLVEPGGRGGRGAAVSGLSPDGKWLSYGINRSDGNNELRVTNVSTGVTKTTAFGTDPVFSFDSRWLAFSIGYSETQADRMRRDNRPVQNKLGLMNLATGEQVSVPHADLVRRIQHA